MKFTAKTIPELRRMMNIKTKDIIAIMSYDTYLNWIRGKSDPFYDAAKKETKINFMKLFKIDEKTFRKLLKNTLKDLQLEKK